MKKKYYLNVPICILCIASIILVLITTFYYTKDVNRLGNAICKEKGMGEFYDYVHQEVHCKKKQENETYGGLTIIKID